MTHRVIKQMPTAEQIIREYPISDAAQKKVEADRNEIRNILSGKDSRLLFIVGPCSAWPYEATLEYAKRLKKLSDEVQDKVKIVMRVYIQKPRTMKGWLGPVNQPEPYAEPDIAEGIKYCRKLMVEIVEMGLPIADEALFTHNAKGFAELLSWIAIGARSVEDQEHRIFASGLDCPAGMKNSTSGSIEVAMNGIVAAQHKHHAVFDGYQVETQGNPYAHLVLRGGASGPNYGVEHVHKAKALFEKHKVKNPAIIVDASHDNCLVNGKKDASLQPTIVKEVLATMKVHPDCRDLVKGFMMESFIKEGNQSLDKTTSETIDRGGLSITDPCLGWEATEETIRYVAQHN
ncbi:MAG: phospho-2-dehydro-3-deoxyheptonate aldolase [Parcubacteria group bacterium GW2011_GWA2_51_10]|nr:MAG: phospho-2-dehydro-3-deoxyheptonate aldolase [Parcubacteria group bacterium GW2011_GWA2_51_10]